MDSVALCAHGITFECLIILYGTRRFGFYAPRRFSHGQDGHKRNLVNAQR